jgi:hypothetical protein
MSALWFWDHDIHVFPVHGKDPAIPRGTSWKDYRCSREQAARLTNYAVPLSAALGVLDTDTREAELWVLQQTMVHRTIPDTPFLVETARGFHRYFQLHRPLPKFLHRDGHTLEFRNEGQYVVGPNSLHPSGKKYQALYWSWRWVDIPFFPSDFVFDDRPPGARGSQSGGPFVFPPVVYAGERHDMLFRQIRSCRHIVDHDEARELIHAMNVHYCQPPLVEDDAFERWFTRAWNKPDRPFPPPLQGLTDLQGF